MHSFYLPPGNLDLVEFSGPDTARLFQGQLTCDVDAIADPGCARGALCNNKGRVLATFIIVRQGPAFFLAMNKGLGAIVMTTLKKYLPFYKCVMRSAEGECVGIAGNTLASRLVNPASVPAGGTCINYADGWMCNVDGGQQQYLLFSHQAPPAPADVAIGTTEAWLVSGLQSGQFPFSAEDSEKFTPQEMHLDRHGYVSFTKGCYTGQEIVARMHYRGKLKKLLFLLEAPSAVSLAEPVEILDSGDELLGTSLKMLHWDGKAYGLALLAAEMEKIPPAGVKNRAGLQFSLRVF